MSSAIAWFDVEDFRKAMTIAKCTQGRLSNGMHIQIAERKVYFDGNKYGLRFVHRAKSHHCEGVLRLHAEFPKHMQQHIVELFPGRSESVGMYITDQEGGGMVFRHPRGSMTKVADKQPRFHVRDLFDYDAYFEEPGVELKFTDEQISALTLFPWQEFTLETNQVSIVGNNCLKRVTAKQPLLHMRVSTSPYDGDFISVEPEDVVTFFHYVTKMKQQFKRVKVFLDLKRMELRAMSERSILSTTLQASVTDVQATYSDVCQQTRLVALDVPRLALFNRLKLERKMFRSMEWDWAWLIAPSGDGFGWMTQHFLHRDSAHFSDSEESIPVSDYRPEVGDTPVLFGFDTDIVKRMLLLLKLDWSWVLHVTIFETGNYMKIDFAEFSLLLKNAGIEILEEEVYKAAKVPAIV